MTFLVNLLSMIIKGIKTICYFIIVYNLIAVNIVWLKKYGIGLDYSLGYLNIFLLPVFLFFSSIYIHFKKKNLGKVEIKNLWKLLSLTILAAVTVSGLIIYFNKM